MKRVVRIKLGVYTQFDDYNTFGSVDYQDLHIRNLEIPINDMLLEMKLIALGVCDFYVIMGMDWLFTRRVLVYYFTKKVMFW